jgi:hypothetical protein
MISFPTISINQQYARIGIDADRATLDLQQPPANMTMDIVDPKQRIDSPRGVLTIDQSKAWDALAKGGNLVMMGRIYDQASNVALQGIARIVEDGNRMAAIHTGENVIAALAENVHSSLFDITYTGPAAYDNVDIHYQAHKPNIEVERGYVDINVQVNRPINNSQRGKLDIYLQNHASIEITPPQIDLKG